MQVTMPKKMHRTKVMPPVRVTPEEDKRYRKAAEVFQEGMAEFTRRSMDLRIRRKKLLEGDWET